MVVIGIFVFLLLMYVVGCIQEALKKKQEEELKKTKALATENFIENNVLPSLKDIEEILPKYGFISQCRIVKHRKKCIYCKKDTVYEIYDIPYYQIYGKCLNYVCINPKCKTYGKKDAT